MSILDRIDNTLAGDLCPCGANPRPDSPYCSYDCEPTHRTAGTTADYDGTQMRWRPDLLTTHDDSGLELVCPGIPIGQHTGTMYWRGTSDTLHLRLDDGHRWAGCDVDGTEPGSAARIQHAWQRLERELGDPRRTEPGRQPVSAWALWQHQRQAAQRAAQERTRQSICTWLRANQLDPNLIPVGSAIRIHNGQITVNLWVQQDGELQIDGDEPVTHPHTVPLIEPWPAGLHYDNLHTSSAPIRPGWHTIPFDTPIQVRAEQLPDFGPTIQRIGQALRQFHTAVAPIAEQMRYIVDAAYEPQPEPADHPLARIAAQRRNQPHGPQQRQRPPRQLRL